MRVRPTRFEVGQWVYLYVPRRRVGKSAKWMKWYTGPFLITKILGPVNVLLQNGPRSKGQVVHVDKLKLYQGPTLKSWLSVVNDTPAESTGALSVNHPEVGPPNLDTGTLIEANVAEEETQITRPGDQSPDAESSVAAPLNDSSGQAAIHPSVSVRPSEPTPPRRPQRNAPRPRRYLNRVTRTRATPLETILEENHEDLWWEELQDRARRLLAMA